MPELTVQKIPVVLSAWMIDPEDTSRPDWVQRAFNRGKCKWVDGVFTINTLEGRMQANERDFLIRGVHGELYACRANIFKETYRVLQ
jgi:hypothetical protein